MAGEPFLSRILHSFKAAGVTRVVLALGYRADDVIAAIENMVPPGMVLLPSVEPAPMGTGGAIRYALPLIFSDDVLVANGDSAIDYPLARLIDFHRQRNARASLLLCHVPDVSRYGTVTVDGEGSITSFHEKQAGANHPGLINAGVYMMAHELIAGFPSQSHSLETAILPSLCRHGLYGLTTHASFIDIGTPDDYGKAAEYFSQLD